MYSKREREKPIKERESDWKEQKQEAEAGGQNEKTHEYFYRTCVKSHLAPASLQGHVAVVLRKPSVRNFKWRITVYAQLNFYSRLALIELFG